MDIDIKNHRWTDYWKFNLKCRYREDRGKIINLTAHLRVLREKILIEKALSYLCRTGDLSKWKKIGKNQKVDLMILGSRPHGITK